MPDSEANPYRWIGPGLYTIAEAARLTGISQGRIRRWMKGYAYVRGDEKRTSPPVFSAHYELTEHGTLALSFLDLIEVRFVDAFRQAGVSWLVLRTAHAKAAEEMGLPHPFATRKFATDGHAILSRAGASALLDIVGGQLSFYRIMKGHLAKGLEFRDQRVVRWWPMGRRHPVVIDAARSFGQPIVSKEGVPTATLHRAYLAESHSSVVVPLGSATPIEQKKRLTVLVAPAIERVARWFDVERRSVRAAVEYEMQLAA